jgi:triphosphoribosyl-dephospho-CoA synthase
MFPISIQHGFPVGAAATLACLHEATARKPGNVHPGQTFDDGTNYGHFVQSAIISGPILGRVNELGVGRAVLDAVCATRQAVGTNTNLGTLLLLAPLAAVPDRTPLAMGIGKVLRRLTFDDTRCVYEAIRKSAAGGLGRSEKADVLDDPPAKLGLAEAMSLAAGRDLVARQYTNSYSDVFTGPALWIEESLSCGIPLERAIINAHVRQLAAWPDSLIHRKCGPIAAKESSELAGVVLKAGSPGDAAYQSAVSVLDRWLRADGHRRNPGTTADLIAAGLFVLLREGRLHWSAW